MEQIQKKILLISDLPGYGNVALSAAMPILSHMGHDIYNLPTALVSNTLNYGKFYILDTTEYMKQTTQVWEELGFVFDAISIGFIASEQQREFLLQFCREQKKQGAKIFIDPIMGDEGKFYNGVGMNTVVDMQKLCTIADCIIPNYTEAAFLAGKDATVKSVTEEEAYALVDAIRKMGVPSVVISSAIVNEQNAVIGFDATTEEYFIHPFEYIEQRFFGTGDIFAALLLGKAMQGVSISKATQYAMWGVSFLIRTNLLHKDKLNGLQIVAYLEQMEKAFAQQEGEL